MPIPDEPLFANLGLNDVPDDTRAPDGDYLAEVIGVREVPDHDNLPEGRRWMFTYEIVEGAWEGWRVSRQQACSARNHNQDKVRFKRFVCSHGIASQTVETITQEDLEGRLVSVRVRGGKVVYVQPRQ